MKKNCLLLTVLLLSLLFLGGCAGQGRHMFMKSSEAEITEARYRIYDKKGNPADMEAILASSENSDVVFIGESHGDPAAHFLEAEILKKIYLRCQGKNKKSRSLTLSLEMFERDTQPMLDEYLGDLITERHFTGDARPWHNYRRDYRPLVEFAKEKQLPVIAANAPGRYVNRVSRMGPEALNDLSPLAKSWLPPLPYAQASHAYREKFRNFWEENEKKRAEMEKKGHKMPKSHAPVSPPPSPKDMKEETQFENLLAAQSLWDAAMAHAISEELKKRPGSLILHVNGQFHSAQGLGIPEHLISYRPETKILTVTVLPLKSFPDFPDEALDAGDFVILTDPELLRPLMGMGS